jgi:hypothetical protein
MAIRNMTGTFTRPSDTTAYASGDLVANSTTAGSVAAVELKHIGNRPGGTSIIRRCIVRKSGTSTTNASFRVHLYRSSVITFANGDNGAWSTSGVANYLGYFDVTVGTAFTDGAHGAAGPAVGSEVLVKFGVDANSVNVSSVWAVLEARGAYTPTSAEVFVVGVDLIDETP